MIFDRMRGRENGVGLRAKLFEHAAVSPQERRMIPGVHEVEPAVFQVEEADEDGNELLPEHAFALEELKSAVQHGERVR